MIFKYLKQPSNVCSLYRARSSATSDRIWLEGKSEIQKHLGILLDRSIMEKYLPLSKRERGP